MIYSPDPDAFTPGESVVPTVADLLLMEPRHVELLGEFAHDLCETPVVLGQDPQRLLDVAYLVASGLLVVDDFAISVRPSEGVAAATGDDRREPVMLGLALNAEDDGGHGS